MARKKRGGIIMGALGGVLIVGGGAVLAGLAFAPEEMERGYGTLKVAFDSTVETVQEEVFEQLPTFTIGVVGDIPELDRCDGTFTIMRSYEHEGVPETAAAHNNCGGDIVLSWEEGQRVQSSDGDIYEVIDIRYTSKIWATTDDLVGLQGDLALQSCFYGEDKMKFVGLELVEEA